MRGKLGGRQEMSMATNVISLVGAQSSVIDQGPRPRSLLESHDRDSLATAIGSEVSSSPTPVPALDWAAAVRALDTAATSGRSNLLHWLIPAAAIVAALVYLVSRQMEGPQVAPRGATVEQGTVVSPLEVNKQLGDSIGDRRGVLLSVTDKPSAHYELGLQDVDDRLQHTDEAPQSKNLVARPAERRHRRAGHRR
jgi:hypothetical protein